MAAKQKWSDLSKRSRTLIIIAGVIEVSLLVAALIDIARRPASQIRGSKRSGPRWRSSTSSGRFRISLLDGGGQPASTGGRAGGEFLAATRQSRRRVARCRKRWISLLSPA